MSLPKKDSLLGLASQCTELNALLEKAAWEQVDFDRALNLLNVLQANCPNHDAIVSARVTWYQRGFENIEACRSEILEAVFNDCYQNRLTRQLMTLYTLTWFLRRSYLKDDFATLFPEVVAFLSLAVADAKDGHLRNWLDAETKNLRQKLLEGRL